MKHRFQIAPGVAAMSIAVLITGLMVGGISRIADNQYERAFADARPAAQVVAFDGTQVRRSVQPA